MITPLKRSILGLILCAATAAGATAPGLATSSAAVPSKPTISVTARVTTVYLNVPTPRAIAVRRSTLHITGSGFTPGSRVTIAVVNTSSWKLFAKISTYAQFAIRQCSWTIRDCSEPNPAAGTISYTLHLKQVVKASNLVVLYRYAGRLAMLAVKTH